MEEYSYTSTHPLGNTGPVTGTFYVERRAKKDLQRKKQYE